MKRYQSILSLVLVLMLTLSLAGCKVTEQEPDSSEINSDESSEEIPDEENSDEENPDEEEQEEAAFISGSYTLDTSSQYNNAVLKLKQLDEALVLFECNVMEGSESEDTAAEYILSGVMLMEEDQVTGIYETDPDAKTPITLTFAFDADEKGVQITHTGDSKCNPDGHYTFIEDTIEVTPGLASELIYQLPTAATSLNANLGAYTVLIPDLLISEWFYPVEAVFDDSGATISKFFVSKDLTAVIRADDDIEPVLIWGSLDSMLDAEYYFADFAEETENSGELEENEELPENLTVFPVVSIGLDKGTTMAEGESAELKPELPVDLPYTLEITSADDSILSAEGNTITAIQAGNTELNVTLTLFDSSKTYQIPFEITAADSIIEEDAEDIVLESSDN